MKRLLFGLLFGALLAVPSAHAGLYWNQGVRSTPITVCFVGNALTARPDRVAQILDYINGYGLAANIQFQFIGTCPASVPQGGMDWFGGDIRVVIPAIDVSGTGMVPGLGCPMFGGAGAYNGGNDGWGSWSNAPDDLVPNRPCRYNLKLGDDPWNDTPYRNHALHEFGHALGLSHEHARADATCPGPGGVSFGYLTPYDTQSVMHYQFLSCGVDGNYANTGLSVWDRLSARILYPEVGRPAQIVGKKTLVSGETANLRFGWRVEGAYMPFVATAMEWRVDGVVVSTAIDLVPVFASPGNFNVALKVTDFLGRQHNGSALVRVISPAQMAGVYGTLATINSKLMWHADYAIFANGFE